MIKLPKRKAEWIDLEGGRLKVDYPQGEHSHKLQDLFVDLSGKKSEMLDFARLYIKYTVKDWENLFEIDGEELKCKLKDNELDDDVWKMITEDYTIVLKLYEAIESQIGWSDLDKKK